MGLGFLNSGDSETEDVVDDDFVELDAEMSETEEKVVIRAETLKEFNDVEKVQEHLRNDHVVWVNIQPLKNREMADLKRAIKRLKKTVASVDGDMAGVDEEWIVACPEYATIHRSGKVGKQEE
jgi:SepF-like predicted cell division protein (DUF552 family)